MSKSHELLDPSDIGTAKRPKTNKTVSTTNSQPAIPVSGVWGVLLFFVSVSIIFANYMVFFGSPFSWTTVGLLAPSTAFVALLVLYKFVK